MLNLFAIKCARQMRRVWRMREYIYIYISKAHFDDKCDISLVHVMNSKLYTEAQQVSKIWSCWVLIFCTDWVLINDRTTDVMWIELIAINEIIINSSEIVI